VVGCSVVERDSRAEGLETLAGEFGRQGDFEGSCGQSQADPNQMAYQEQVKAMMIPDYCDAV
jgi:hypothetical protein